MRRVDSMESFPSSQEISESFNRIQALQGKADIAKSKLFADIGAAKAVSENITEVNGRIEVLTSGVQNLEKVSSILSSIGEERQKETQEQIEVLVTQGLQKIFGDNLSFHVVQTVKARTPAVEFFIRTKLEDG